MQDFWPRRAGLGPPAIKGRTDSFDQAEPSEAAEQRKSKWWVTDDGGDDP